MNSKWIVWLLTLKKDKEDQRVGHTMIETNKATNWHLGEQSEPSLAQNGILMRLQLLRKLRNLKALTYVRESIRNICSSNSFDNVDVTYAWTLIWSLLGHCIRKDTVHRHYICSYSQLQSTILLIVNLRNHPTASELQLQLIRETPSYHVKWNGDSSHIGSLNDYVDDIIPLMFDLISCKTSSQHSGR